MTTTPGSHAPACTLLVGTKKGLFRVGLGTRCGGTRIDGPHLAGYRVQHVDAAPQRPRELLAAVDHPVWGSHIHRSDDGGAHWTSLDAAPQHPPGRHTQALQSVWHLAWSPDGERLYAGIDPAGLFVSDDRGASWQDVPTLNDIYGIVANSPWGIAGPRSMEPRTVGILHDAFRRASADPAFLQVLDRAGWKCSTWQARTI